MLDWSVAGNKSKESHLTFITQLQDKLAELTDRVVQGKYKDVATQVCMSARACVRMRVRACLRLCGPDDETCA